MARSEPAAERPAFYALASGGWRDLVTLLHPPYTAWHLSYVAIGAAMAPRLHSWRLAQVLVSLAQKHGQPDGPRVRIPVRLSQQDLGSMVGATRESVNKQLRKWTQTGVLHQETGCVVISDFPALRAAGVA